MNWRRKYLLKMRNLQRWKNQFVTEIVTKTVILGGTAIEANDAHIKRNSYLWSWPRGKPSLKRSMEEQSGKQVVKNQDQCPQNVFRKFPCKYKLEKKSYLKLSLYHTVHYLIVHDYTVILLYFPVILMGICIKRRTFLVPNLMNKLL